ncbi:MAG: hypothetical protein RBR59_03285 [Sulfurimonadaceae bacterium]|jgi:hypothetical protein|nr:hypothetical protein [Sulfurimonadaceae bacterium]
MKISKFIEITKEYLHLGNFEKASKKKSIKILLKKLRTKRKEIKKQIQEQKEELSTKELEDELGIVCWQIKKGKELLKKLEEKEL